MGTAPGFGKKRLDSTPLTIDPALFRTALLQDLGQRGDDTRIRFWRSGTTAVAVWVGEDGPLVRLDRDGNYRTEPKSWDNAVEVTVEQIRAANDQLAKLLESGRTDATLTIRLDTAGLVFSRSGETATVQLGQAG